MDNDELEYRRLGSMCDQLSKEQMARYVELGKKIQDQQTKLNIEAINAIEALVYESSPAPWTHEGGRQFRCGSQGDYSIAYRTQDAKFITHARTAVPALLGRVRELESTILRNINQLDKLRDLYVLKHHDEREDCIDHLFIMMEDLRQALENRSQ